MSTAQFDIFQRALRFVSTRCNVTAAALDSSSREARVVFARQVLAWLLRYRGGMSLPEIGLLMNRCHTSVFHSLRSLNNRVETNAATARKVATLIHEFTTRNSHPSQPSTLNPQPPK